MGIKEFASKYKWLIVVILALPLLVAIAFLFEGFIPIGVEIERKDWLTFWCGALTFYGTMSLGLLAFWQNETSKALNKSLIDMERYKEVPFIEAQFLNVDTKEWNSTVIKDEENAKFDFERNLSTFFIKYFIKITKKKEGINCLSSWTASFNFTNKGSVLISKIRLCSVKYNDCVLPLESEDNVTFSILQVNESAVFCIRVTSNYLDFKDLQKIYIEIEIETIQHRVYTENIEMQLSKLIGKDSLEHVEYSNVKYKCDVVD